MLARDNYEDLWRNNYITGEGVIWESVYTDSSPISFGAFSSADFRNVVAVSRIHGFLLVGIQVLIHLSNSAVHVVGIESARICRSEQARLFFT